MQDLSVFDSQDGFFFGILLGISRKGSNHFIGFTLVLINPKIILKQLLSPKDLPRAQAFCIYEVA